MYRDLELGKQVLDEPELARVRILGAVRRCRGYVSDAARALRVSARSLHRWIVDLDLRADVEAAKRASGSPARGRRGKRHPYGPRQTTAE